MESKLYHCFSDTKEEFFRRIDRFGGWPHNAESVVMGHTGIDGERPCYFCTTTVRDEYNTSIYTSDDYYWWKLSQRRKDKFEKEIREKIRNSI